MLALSDLFFIAILSWGDNANLGRENMKKVAWRVRRAKKGEIGKENRMMGVREWEAVTR